MTSRQRVLDSFAERCGRPAQFLVRAPGRINLIGEHTDYNDGFVLPMAIDRATWIALEPSDDGACTAFSLDLGQGTSFFLGGDLSHGDGWDDYARGVAWSLRQGGYELRGWRGVIGSDVPIGAGLSSSASLELAIARAFAVVGGHAWDPVSMAKLAQRAESQWVGLNCGIMDQLIVAAGHQGQALHIDCRSLTFDAIPVPGDVAILVLDSAAPRTLATSAYNVRRAQCESVVAAVSSVYPGVRALRDVTQDMLHSVAGSLTHVELMRARHVITENERVAHSVEAMRLRDSRRLGQLMYQSHESLRRDYEVSSNELDLLVSLARAEPGVLGARLTGAGFGGCVVAVVKTEFAPIAAASIIGQYRNRSGRDGRAFVSTASAGASVEDL